MTESGKIKYPLKQAGDVLVVFIKLKCQKQKGLGGGGVNFAINQTCRHYARDFEPTNPSKKVSSNSSCGFLRWSFIHLCFQYIALLYKRSHNSIITRLLIRHEYELTLYCFLKIKRANSPY